MLILDEYGTGSNDIVRTIPAIRRPKPASPVGIRECYKDPMTERTYRLISGDSHVNEPGDLWTARVPAQFRDRAPRIDRFEQGDAWVIEGVRDPINFGMNACAGLEPSEMHAWSRFEDMRHGGYDPTARVAEMDQDGVDAEVLYPTPRLAQGIVAAKEVDFHLAFGAGVQRLVVGVRRRSRRNASRA